MAVRAYCVWEKVVIEVGASPWKLEPVTEWIQWQLWWGLLDVGSVLSQRGRRWSCGRGQRSLLWRHWSNMVFSRAMWCTEGAEKDTGFGQSHWEEGFLGKNTKKENRERFCVLQCAFKTMKEGREMCLKYYHARFWVSHFLLSPTLAPLIYTITIIKQSFFFFFFFLPPRLSAESILEKSFFQAIHQGYTGTNLRTWLFNCLFSSSSNTNKAREAHKFRSKLLCFTYMPTNIIIIYCTVHILFLTGGLS